MLSLMEGQPVCSRQRGFTIVEMIVVMAILGVVIMAVMSLYIPAVRSTSVQTEVSDIQANLRLAINRMTKDIVLAGFLVNPGFGPGSPVASGAIFWEGDVNPEDTDDLTIRTRTVGNAFARVLAYDATGKIGLSDADMALAFPPGTSIRLFEPMTSEEVDGVVYSVTNNKSLCYY